MKEPLYKPSNLIRARPGIILKKSFPYLHKEMNKLKAICVYCGSATGTDPAYVRDAAMLSRIFIDNKIRLINGGGSIGLMGVMADAMMEGGGEAVGIIPLSLKEKEIAHLGMTELIVVPDMHSRKLMMVNLADAFIALPGGFGTLDEVFETLTWAQLHLHQKPIILYNLNGYFDNILAQADRMVSEGFLNSTSRALLMSTTELHRLLPMLVAFTPPSTDKWIHTSGKA
jgi:uncharacterized protein (TIGR00730 family)